MRETIPQDGTYGSRGLWNFVITNVPQPPVFTEADFMRRQDINFDVPHFPYPLRHAHLTGDWVCRIFAAGDNDIRCLNERGDIRTVRMTDLLNANARNMERWQNIPTLHVSAEDYVWLLRHDRLPQDQEARLLFLVQYMILLNVGRFGHMW